MSELSQSGAFCRACGATIDSRAVVCPKCGVPQRSASASQGHPNAVLALVLNVFLPGVGTLVLGQTSTGITQIILSIIAIPLWIVLIGIPLSIGVWIWAIVVAAQSFKSASP